MSETVPDLKNSHVIYKGRVFNVTVDDIAYPDGRIVRMEVVRHPRLRRALTDDGARTAFCWLSSIDTSWTDGCGSFQRARASRDETLHSAALRECHEEVGKVAGHARSCSAFSRLQVFATKR